MVLLAFFVAACAPRVPPAEYRLPDAVAANSPAPPGLGDALRVASPEEATAWRVVVATTGTIEVAPGQPFTPQGHPREPLVVVSDDGERVRVLGQAEGMRTIVAVRRSDLALLPVERLSLAPTPDTLRSAWSTPYAPGIEITAGTPVTLGKRVGDATHVSWEENGFAVGGWVATRTLGPLWRVEPSWWSGDLVPAHPDRPLVIRDAPGGQVIATVPVDRRIAFASRAPVVGAWRFIEARAESVVVGGWVRSAEVRAHEGEYGYGVGGLWGSSGALHATWVTLGEGVYVYAQDPHGAPAEGAPFALAERDARVVLDGDDGTIMRVRVQTDWGLLPGWAACARRDRGGEVAKGREGGEVRCLP